MSLKLLFSKVSEPSAAIIALVIIAAGLFVSLSSNKIAVTALEVANESSAQVRQLREELSTCTKDKEVISNKLNVCNKRKK